MNSRSLKALLNQENSLQIWQNKAKLLKDIECFWYTLLIPAWRDHNYIAGLENGELTVAVTHNSVLAKIKQLGPSLLIQIKDRFPDITSLKFKMVVTQSEKIRLPPPNQTLSINTLAYFEETHSKIKTGPVAEALQRLLRHHKKNNIKS
ncbi:DciA family protein [Ferrovum sp. PN-J185]|uniref:DciA family protein n=1 Tax=Ferrovum sp. PN-J185 TaxID=1356306 RepID=UPI00079C9400|nr:DciA family protein [Ferrovum sp. PN-J185]KXW56272.1 hypothetical protein FV185_02200 [Ferrovum sp. PN-J185]MCC6068996.1 DciA family protein [Ferrovum sp. PN-J185]MDE1891024.1 DUF721 domain-containing protein [Betaproteobacteria bacterium]MDE2055664.1 DUF721 domain-containing protein [Betaproteobacteria bacterium]